MSEPKEMPESFVNKICIAWKMPQERLADIFIEIDNLEERKAFKLHMCFLQFLYLKYDHSMLTNDNVKKYYNEKHYDEFFHESIERMNCSIKTGEI